MADRLTQLQEAVNQASHALSRHEYISVRNSLSLSIFPQLGELFCNSIGVLQQPETEQQPPQQAAGERVASAEPRAR